MKKEDLSSETKRQLKDSTASKVSPTVTLGRNAVSIDASAKMPGNPGLPGKKGKAGDMSVEEPLSCAKTGGPGLDGGNGRDGENGSDAGDISVHLEADEKNDEVCVKLLNYESKPSRDLNLPLGDSRSTIQLKANGGAGGDGGNGGWGAQGACGWNGRNATKFSPGTDGTPGGPGSNGGDGGCGGNGGRGGDIRVIIASHDMDLVMLIDDKAINMQGGPGGKGGNAGRGGEGGLGGCKGNDYHCYTEYGLYTISGGKAGQDGAPGKSGRPGLDGRKGKLGTFTIYISDIDKEYPGCYHLTWQGHKLIESKDGVIEPGEKLSIRNITFKNSGKMPTPKTQPIGVYLKNNNWVYYEESKLLFVSESIVIGGKYKLPQRLTFRVKDNGFPMAINSTFRQIATLDYGARVSRVNKSFKSVTKIPATFVVSYPVEIAPVAVADAITRDSEAPFAVKIRNVSNQVIGMKADKPRLVELNLIVNRGIRGEDIQFQNKQGKLKFLINAAHKPIKKLSPKGATYFSGTLKFDNEAIPLYTTVEFKVGLELGNIYRPTKRLQRIQERTFSIQLTEPYQYNPEADFVLVINRDTTREAIQRWEEMACTFGTRMSKWNISLYSGFSYFENLKGKVVIFLNNRFKIQKTQTNKCATDYVNHLDIFQAAKANNIATYVKGSGFSMCEIQDPLAESDYENKFEESVVHERLPQTRAYVAHRDISDEAVHQVESKDIYAVIKLLALRKKLDYITRVLENGTYRKILKKAILSDLVDELIVFGNSKWSGTLHRGKLRKSLKALETLSTYDFSKVLEYEAGKLFVKVLLITYKTIAKKFDSNFGKKFFRRREQILRDIVCSKVKELQKQYKLLPSKQERHQNQKNYEFYIKRGRGEPNNIEGLKPAIYLYRTKKSSDIIACVVHNESGHETFNLTEVARSNGSEKLLDKMWCYASNIVDDRIFLNMPKDLKYKIKSRGEHSNNKTLSLFWRKICRTKILEQYSTPYPFNDILFNNHVGYDVPQSCCEQKKAIFAVKTIVEKPFSFRSISERRKEIKTFEKNCHFEKDTDQVVIKPGISRKSKLQKGKKSKTKSKGKSKVSLFEQTGQHRRTSSSLSKEKHKSSSEVTKIQM